MARREKDNWANSCFSPPSGYLRGGLSKNGLIAQPSARLQFSGPHSSGGVRASIIHLPEELIRGETPFSYSHLPLPVNAGSGGTCTLSMRRLTHEHRLTRFTSGGRLPTKSYHLFFLRVAAWSFVPHSIFNAASL